MNFKGKISVIIPCFNEQYRIENTLNEVIDYLNSYANYEIIIINDGSTDKTLDIIKKYGNNTIIINNESNFGKGYSVKIGILNSIGDICLIIDADNSTPIYELDKFIKYIDQYDLIIGSRYISQNSITKKQPLVRRIIGFIRHKILSKLFISGITDTQCGFKLINKKSAHILFRNLFTKRFGYDLEILLKAQKLNLKIKEIDVKWESKPGSKFNSFSDGIKTIIEFLIIKYKINEFTK